MLITHDIYNSRNFIAPLDLQEKLEKFISTTVEILLPPLTHNFIVCVFLIYNSRNFIAPLDLAEFLAYAVSTTVEILLPPLTKVAIKPKAYLQQ